MVKKSPHNVRTLNKRTQVIRSCYAFYDMIDGFIELGCEEKFVATAIWHEQIHKILFEKFFLEANFMWDNIADDLAVFLFNSSIPDKPYVSTLPAFRAKPEDDGWYKGRKATETSKRVGWNPDPKTRKTVHPKDRKTLKTRVTTYKTYTYVHYSY